jgi:hypothetical protein
MEKFWINVCLINLSDKYIPKVKINPEFQPPWFDSELYAACNKKDGIRKNFKDSESLLNDLKFTASRKDSKRMYSSMLRDILFNSDDPATGHNLQLLLMALKSSEKIWF